MLQGKTTRPSSGQRSRLRKPADRRRRSLSILVLWVLTSVIYCWLSLVLLPEERSPVYSGDGEIFHDIARQPITSSAFWAASRPWTVPLLHKLADSNPQRVVNLQIALSLVAHVILAFVVLGSLRRSAVALAAAAGVYVYALLPGINGWTLVMRSESAAFSLTAMFLAALIVLIGQLNRRPFRVVATCAAAIGFMSVSILFVFSRDNWSHLLPFVAILLAAPLASRRVRSRQHRAQLAIGLTMAVLLLGLWGIQTRNGMAGDRWRPGLMNVIFKRILPDEAKRKLWVERYEMPFDPQIASLSGEFDIGLDSLGYRHREFQDWLTRRGVRSYVHYVATHPIQHAGETWRTFRDGFKSLPPFAPELILILCIFIPLGIALRTREPRLKSLALGVFIVSAGLPVQMAVCYLADAQEVMRHILSVTVTLRLLAVLTLSMVVWIGVRRWGLAIRRARRPKTALPAA